MRRAWKPHLAHLPLAVKWGVRSISALAWYLAGVHFRFAANALGQIYASQEDLETQREWFSDLLMEYTANYLAEPSLVVNALKIQSAMMGLGYDVAFLRDVADAACGTYLG